MNITVQYRGWIPDEDFEEGGRTYGVIHTNNTWISSPWPGDLMPRIPQMLPGEIAVVRQRRWLDPENLIIDVDIMEL